MKQVRICMGIAVWCCLMAGLVSCGSGQSQAKETKKPEIKETEASGQEESQSLKIGIAIYRFDDNFMTLYREELKKYLEEEYQAQVTVLNGKGDSETQAAQIDTMISQNYDAMILNMVKPSEAKAVADKCQKAGIPVVFINRRPASKEITRWETDSMKASYVGSDEKQSGTYQGEIILGTHNHGDISGDGVVSYVMIGGERGNLASEYRSEYAVKALEESGLSTKQLWQGFGDWKEDKGEQIAKESLSRFGTEIEVIFCSNDAMANGARKAILSAGRHIGDDIYLVGVDALRDTVGYVKDGTMTGTVLNDHVGQSHQAADAAVLMARGAKADAEYMIDYIKIVLEDEK